MIQPTSPSPTTILLASFLAILFAANRAATGHNIPEFLPGVEVGTLESPDVTEASGIAASQRNPGVLWTHNDSGDSARTFALSATGRHLGTYNLAGIAAIDIEDMAVGPGPTSGESYLYLGDIGDNSGRTSIAVYRVPEPRVRTGQAPVEETIGHVDILRFAYPGIRSDAETLMIDPLNADIYVVTKNEPSKLYRSSFPQSTTEINVLEFVADLADGREVLGGDISPDGDEILVRYRFAASLWQRPPGTDMAEAVGSERFLIRRLRDGEAIGFDARGAGFFTVNEGLHPPLRYHMRLVPEPSTLLLALSALCLLVGDRRKGRR